ncbi:MAG TPA: hypothetical protein VF070_06100 [Streptosporangiaceae bacterium]
MDVSEDIPPTSVRWTPGRLLAGVRRVLGFGVMRASAPLRSKSGQPIRARAWLESAKIEEKYQYSQEISLNAAVRRTGEPAGEIKLVLPYDGEKYFTRQAHRDVSSARDAGAAPADEAIVGFLALTGYEKTNLEGALGLEDNYGSAPIRVRLPSPPGAGEDDQLLTDLSACVVSHEYRPEEPQVIPVHIGIELDDPDTAGIRRRQEMLGRYPERQLDFEPDLWLRMTVRLYLPRSRVEGAEAKVSKVFMSWPTHTSLSSLDLRAAGQARLRYNPEEEHEGHKGGLEWSDVPMALEAAEPAAEQARISDASDDDDEIVTLSSREMTLYISKPGELYKRETLSGRVEVTVNRLLSGVDARLFDATGMRCRPRRPGLKLKSTVTTEFSLPLDDAFARRTLSPYQWLHFDEVIPSGMRIDDIVTALRNRGFKVSEPHDPDPENCWLTAQLVHGPDRLRLDVYVTGEQHKTKRKRSVKGGMTYRTAVGSGELRIYVFGSLRADSQPVVHEINALRRALRERFDRLPARRLPEGAIRWTVSSSRGHHTSGATNAAPRMCPRCATIAGGRAVRNMSCRHRNGRRR